MNGVNEIAPEVGAVWLHGVQDDREKNGTDRLIEALQCNMWNHLSMKANPHSHTRRATDKAVEELKSSTISSTPPTTSSTSPSSSSNSSSSSTPSSTSTSTGSTSTTTTANASSKLGQCDNCDEAKATMRCEQCPGISVLDFIHSIPTLSHCVCCQPALIIICHS